MIIRAILILYILSNVIIGCKNDSYLPKPRTYPYINFPEGKRQSVSPAGCPFKFEFPEYGIVEKDSTFFDKPVENNCWLNIQIPALNGTIYFSYYLISNQKQLEKSIQDAYKLAREHQIRANYVDELPISKPGKVYGMLFNIEGPAASSFQFYLTDSSTHFVRASLYFNAQARPDSLSPIIAFAKKDIVQLINTFEWQR
jgi:gliding motility-associated lipoprotein GldD